MTKLVILESPGKIKKVSQYLKEIDSNNTYIVKASIGHIRQLSNSGIDNMGIDINSMIPTFEISKDKTTVVKELIEAAKKTDEIILATDPDREGEAIAFHLYEILKNQNKNFKRMRLNAITKECVLEQIKNLSTIDQNYVNAALSRQMLDRMVGYKVSPILQKTIGANSAGRVQSAVLRILCNRQFEIENFNKKQYWYLQDQVINGLTFKNYIYNENNKLVINKFYEKNKMDELVQKLSNKYIIKDIKTSSFEENKFKPFSTADLLKAAKSKSKFKSKLTTEISQKLYEKGLITYIRTDSNNLDEQTEKQLTDFVVNYYGVEKLGKLTKTNAKESDQEGHPAITPTHFEWIPKDIQSNCDVLLTTEEVVLYQLIWQNTINSIYKKPSGIKKEIFLDNSNQIFYTTIKQFLNLGYYEIDETISIEENGVFNHQVNDTVSVNKIEIIEETEKPPSRLNEISLIEQLQKLQIGRPSTYKSAIEVNVLRGYVELEQTKNESMIVNDLGLKVNDFLEKNFIKVINLEFTKEMEKDLDLIASGKIENYKNYLKNFYNQLDELTKTYNFDGKICDKCGNGFVVDKKYMDKKTKKLKSFKGCSNYPNCDFVEFEQPDYSKNKQCGLCNIGFMIDRKYTDKKTNKSKSFKGCSDYPTCKNAEF